MQECAIVNGPCTLRLRKTLVEVIWSGWEGKQPMVNFAIYSTMWNEDLHNGFLCGIFKKIVRMLGTGVISWY